MAQTIMDSAGRRVSNSGSFFGAYDVSFMCGAGHWRESLHSGKYGHDADIPELDLHSEGFYMLSGNNWLRASKWRFDDYNSILAIYTGREISFQYDILNAIAGCLQIIAEKHDIKFLRGIPSKDFHYALLWSREYDRPREGFPSWSWAGWHTRQQIIDIYPKKGDSGYMVELEDGSYKHRGPQPNEFELQGFYVSPIEHPHVSNHCSQELAQVRVAASADYLTITSESVHFFIDIVADQTKSYENDRVGPYPSMRSGLDSTIDSDESWEPETEYLTPYERIRLRDSSGNSYASHIPRWDSTDTVNLPRTIRGSTLTWLLRDGIELIKIVGIKSSLGGADSLKLNHICCLGFDRIQRNPPRVTRMGKFWIPREWWEKARPKEVTVAMWQVVPQQRWIVFSPFYRSYS
ncbi:hypothetical protein BDV34DRAFT_219208 [Aspergillus parasiticus]|uniref:Heterokaryon incompatibility domain-containing protein n=1 Tax=Aspergillus parasiticus TaxID=5067 RepID=A0A5N6E392_ASPPA|nr:hypothetical protein BDV34DRAFT_219208 [Aspergillus parasiticus]